jgi:superfamily II DNA or RNA helicase
MPAPSSEHLLHLLKDHFGYDSWRPLQQEIITATMAGRDVLALLPTGGGKSLCFQLPAMAGQGLTLVVSPLIALFRGPERGRYESLEGSAAQERGAAAQGEGTAASGEASVARTSARCAVPRGLS